MLRAVFWTWRRDIGSLRFQEYQDKSCLKVAFQNMSNCLICTPLPRLLCLVRSEQSSNVYGTKALNRLAHRSNRQIVNALLHILAASSNGWNFGFVSC